MDKNILCVCGGGACGDGIEGGVGAGGLWGIVPYPGAYPIARGDFHGCGELYAVDGVPEPAGGAPVEVGASVSHLCADGDGFVG